MAHFRAKANKAQIVITSSRPTAKKRSTVIAGSGAECSRTKDEVGQKDRMSVTAPQRFFVSFLAAKKKENQAENLQQRRYVNQEEEDERLKVCFSSRKI